jgi:hypothetical protein
VSVDAAEERAAFGRHGGDLFVGEVRLVPLGPQRVVAVEDGDAIVLLGVPVHRGVVQACETERQRDRETESHAWIP